jgi:hypothetical protein
LFSPDVLALVIDLRYTATVLFKIPIIIIIVVSTGPEATIDHSYRVYARLSVTWVASLVLLQRTVYRYPYRH